MDITAIIPFNTIVMLALTIVGITNVVKNLITRDLDKRLATVLTIGVGIVVVALYLLLPDKWQVIMVALLAIAVSVTMYDTIFQLFKKMIDRINLGTDRVGYAGESADGD